MGLKEKLDEIKCKKKVEKTSFGTKELRCLVPEEDIKKYVLRRDIFDGWLFDPNKGPDFQLAYIELRKLLEEIGQPPIYNKRIQSWKLVKKDKRYVEKEEVIRKLIFDYSFAIGKIRKKIDLSCDYVLTRGSVVNLIDPKGLYLLGPEIKEKFTEAIEKYDNVLIQHEGHIFVIGKDYVNIKVK